MMFNLDEEINNMMVQSDAEQSLINLETDQEDEYRLKWVKIKNTFDEYEKR